MEKAINDVNNHTTDKENTNLWKYIMIGIIALWLALTTWCTNNKKDKASGAAYTETEFVLNSNRYNLPKVKLIETVEINDEKYRIQITYWSHLKKINTEFIDDDTKRDETITWDEYIISDNTIWPYQIIKDYRSWDKYILIRNTYEYEVYHDNDSEPIGWNRNSSLKEIKQWIINTIHMFEKIQGIEQTEMKNNKIQEIDQIIEKVKDLPKELIQHDTKK